jgi:hypothetical protein
LLFVAIALPVIQALLSAAQAYFPYEPRSPVERLKLHGLTAFLHLLQPSARLWGRLKTNLTPWRRYRATSFAFPWLRTIKIWSERWRAPEERLESIEAALRTQSAVVVRGGDYDDWDLEIRGGLFGSVRTIMAVEDHGSGTQLVRYRAWPRAGLLELLLLFLAALLAIVAAVGQVWPATLLLGLAAIALAIRLFADCAAATASFLTALEQSGTAEEQPIP